MAFDKSVPARRATKDHVVPRCFYLGSLPTNPPTFPVCYGCQQDLSPREERVRNLLVAGARDVEKRLPHGWAKIQRSGRYRPQVVGLLTQAGLVVREKVLDLDQEDLCVVFRKIVLGLKHWAKNPLAPAVPVEAALLPPQVAEQEAATFEAHRNAKVFDGRREVAFVGRNYLDGPETTEWLFRMYESRVVWVGTGVAAARVMPKGQGVIVGGGALKI